ncbi:MAG: hypothetical protein ACK6D5_24145 [Planctomyces sp.]
MAQSASLSVSRLPLTLCSMLLGLLGCLLLPQSALAQTDDNTKAGGGIVWYAGTVLSSAAEAERIDLGDVHGILEGDLLAAFRRTDNHYRPLGTVQIIESHPTWSRPGGPVAAQLQQGDLVLGIRTVRQIGTGSDFSEAFLNRQLIRNSNRNGYSTLREQESAQVLHTIVNRQQRWVKQLKPVAGRIRGASVTPADFQSLQPLLSQIRRCQDFSAIGIPLEKCASPEWAAVTAVLTPRPAVETASSAPRNKQPAAPDASLPNPDSSPDSLAATLNRRIELIQQESSVVLFDRFPEERILANLICTAIGIENPRNEPLWIGLELARSQFPELADDREMQQEIPEILKRVRNASEQ